MLIKSPPVVVASFKHADVQLERERRMLSRVLDERRITVLERVRGMERNIAAVAELRVARGQASNLVALKGTRMNEVVISDMMTAAIHGVRSPRNECVPCPHPAAEFEESWVSIIRDQLQAEGQLTIEEQQRIIRKRREDLEFDDDPTEAPVLLSGAGTNVKVYKGPASASADEESPDFAQEPISTVPHFEAETVGSSTSTIGAVKRASLGKKKKTHPHKKGRLRSVAKKLRKAVNKSSATTSYSGNNTSKRSSEHLQTQDEEPCHNLFDGSEAGARAEVGSHDPVVSGAPAGVVEHVKKRRMKRTMFGSLYNFRNSGSCPEAGKANNQHHDALRSEARVLYPNQNARDGEHFEVDMEEVLKNDPSKSPTKRWSLGGKKTQRELKARLSRSLGSTPNSSTRSLASASGSAKSTDDNAAVLLGSQIGSEVQEQRADAAEPPIIGVKQKGEEPDFEHYRFYFNSKIGSALGIGRSRSWKNKQQCSTSESKSFKTEASATDETIRKRPHKRGGGRSSFRARFALSSFKASSADRSGRLEKASFKDRASSGKSFKDKASFKDRSSKDRSAAAMSFVTVMTQDESTSMSMHSFKEMSTKSFVSQADSEYTIWEEEEDEAEDSGNEFTQGLEPPIPISVPETNFDSVLAC